MTPVRVSPARALRASIATVAVLALAACAGASTGAGPAGTPSHPSTPLATATAGLPSSTATGSASATASPGPSSSTVPPTGGPDGGGLQLPDGGTTLFPHYRLIGYSGGPGSAAFGRLGIGNLDARVREIERLEHSYAGGGRQPLPVLELITVVVQGHPGADGKYRTRIDGTQIDRYLAAARRHHALLLLNIQPGRADFLTEVKALQHWLAQPDVGLALDPEWAIGPRQIPGQVFGHTTAARLNAVAAWLSAFTRARKLPEKALVIHQLAPRIISNVQDLKHYAGVQTILSVDGIGNRAEKVSTWRRLVKPLPASVHPGFKLFFEEDRRHGKLMTPAQVMALRPTPDYVLYE